MALMQLNYRSPALRTAVNVTVYMPITSHVGHQQSAFPKGGKYQVLWLLHGGQGDANDFIKYSNVLRHAEENQIALVIPSCPARFYEEPYFTYVTEELPGLLQSMLPLSERAEDNFIAGLSHGGDCALRAVLEKPGKYGAGLVMSAAGTTHRADTENHLLFDVYGMAKKNLESGIKLPKLIFASGSGDRGFPYYTPVIDQLEALGMPLMRHFVERDGHSWRFWDDTLQLALEQLLPVKHEITILEE